uniref:Beta-glucosidase 10-like isoform X2 n=1 Tax=Cicer arietinum TaxID=3827 RepID=A0A3Q7YB35_CICAR|nr:beta-glucosidase 10-like isoform X2 [Cicer arietinum]
MVVILKIFALLVVIIPNAYSLSRDDFPSDFVFGASTSAYQVEGAANIDGRKPSIWDTFSHGGNGNRYQGNGDIACDQYHKYKEDVELMANMGLEAYRFSISWSRLIPDGKGSINTKGLQYYNNLINELISHGIQPHVTLHHWDLPQKLEDEYGGWVNRSVVLPPQRCSPSFEANCTRGNSSTEPYLVAHHILLAHASAARLYRKNYKGTQHGFVGFNLLAFGFAPLKNNSEDIIATKRAQEFIMGWFLKPLTYGDYPDIMKKNAGSRLPYFTKKESNLVKGSIDFLGINFYYSFYVKNKSPSIMHKENRDYMEDMNVETIQITPNDTLTYEVPITTWSLKGVLDWVKNKYGNFPIYIHENGQQTLRNSSLDDWHRVKYLYEYIGSMSIALRSGSNVKGYFVWSLLDAFELLGGYELSYGLYYIDMNDPSLKRQPKLSAKWYSNFLKRKPMDPKIAIAIQKNALLPSHTSLLHDAK